MDQLLAALEPEKQRGGAAWTRAKWKKKGKERRKGYKPCPTQVRRARKAWGVVARPQERDPLSRHLPVPILSAQPVGSYWSPCRISRCIVCRAGEEKKKSQCGLLRSYSVLMESAGICTYIHVHDAIALLLPTWCGNSRVSQLSVHGVKRHSAGKPIRGARRAIAFARTVQSTSYERVVLRSRTS